MLVLSPLFCTDLRASAETELSLVVTCQKQLLWILCRKCLLKFSTESRVVQPCFHMFRALGSPKPHTAFSVHDCAQAALTSCWWRLVAMDAATPFLEQCSIHSFQIWLQLTSCSVGVSWELAPIQWPEPLERKGRWQQRRTILYIYIFIVIYLYNYILNYIYKIK